MDFKTVLDLMIKDFDEAKVRYGLIGGFDLGVLGAPRSTVDLDFLINRDDLHKMEHIMQSHGYECVYKSDNVSQYISRLKIFGEVDFIHAFRQASLGMLDRATEIDIFDGKLKIKVLKPADIIGLKLQAVTNDPVRTNQELIDIEAIMNVHRSSLDWNLVEEYFSIFEQKEKFLELRKKYHDVK